MLRVFQLCVALLTVSNAFRGTISRAQLKSCNIAMALNRDDDITPKLVRDDMIQPMQRGKITFLILSTASHVYRDADLIFKYLTYLLVVIFLFE